MSELRVVGSAGDAKSPVALALSDGSRVLLPREVLDKKWLAEAERDFFSSGVTTSACVGLNRYAGPKPAHVCEAEHPDGMYCDCACNNCYSVDPIKPEEEIGEHD